MKLYYYKFRKGTKNFGDDLNPWLWEKLIPDLLDEDESTAFVGIGTLLNDTLATSLRKASKKAIFSSGVGYGRGGVPQIDESYKIYCVRGPLSAQALGIPAELAITDGALLIRRLTNINTPKVNRFAYMPHIEQLSDGAWNLVCDQLGFGYIDPRWPIEQILTCISQTEVLLTEAMHGAIVADALRVPWIPVVTHNNVFQFKWQDWCLSIGTEYQPVHLPSLNKPNHKIDILSSARLVRHWVHQKLAAPRLLYAAKMSRPFLSSDTTIERLTVQLEEKVQQFRRDVETGYFSALLSLCGKQNKNQSVKAFAGKP